MHSAHGTVHGDVGVFSMKGLAQMHAKLHIRTLCFVHFFSGFRREGDIQHQIERHEVQGIYQLGDHGRYAHASVQLGLQGCGPDGDFRTAIAKIYPEAMNAAIAQAIAQFVQDTFEVWLFSKQYKES
eukprot:s3048_g16.t1